MGLIENLVEQLYLMKPNKERKYLRVRIFLKYLIYILMLILISFLVWRI